MYSSAAHRSPHTQPHPGRPGYAPALIFLAFSLPWFIFAWGYFGSPLPATLFAKQQQGALAISQRFAPGLWTILEPYGGRLFFWIELVLAALGMWWIIGRPRAIWGTPSGARQRGWRLFFIWPVLYFLAFTLSGVSRYFWYYAPLVPGWIAAIGLGISAALGLPLLSRPALSNRRQPALAGFIILLLLAGQCLTLWQSRGMAAPRIATYRAAGEWLKENIPLSASIGALEVGALGYYSERPIVDFAGLIQPAIAARLSNAASYADSALWAIEKYQPDYVVLHAGIFPELEKILITRNCRLAKEIPGKINHYDLDLIIYRCQIP